MYTLALMTICITCTYLCSWKTFHYFILSFLKCCSFHFLVNFYVSFILPIFPLQNWTIDISVDIDIFIFASNVDMPSIHGHWCRFWFLLYCLWVDGVLVLQASDIFLLKSSWKTFCQAQPAQWYRFTVSVGFTMLLEFQILCIYSSNAFILHSLPCSHLFIVSTKSCTIWAGNFLKMFHDCFCLLHDCVVWSFNVSEPYNFFHCCKF